MAKRKANGQFQKAGRAKARRSSGGGSRTTVIRAPAPIVRVSAPRAPKVKRRRSSGGRSSGVLGSLGGRVGSRTAIVLGSAALGYASKEKWLEKLPVIGKAGPITSFGLLGWAAEEFLKLKVPPLVHDMITSALALSAFNVGFSGGNTLVGDSQGGAVFYD